MTQHNPIIFISYSSKDRKWVDEFKTFMAPMLRNRNFTIWEDSQLKPGDKWRTEIENVIGKASVAILFVSYNFLASDFILNHELFPILEKANAKGLQVLWIPIGRSLYEETEIADFHSAWNPRWPLNALGQDKQEEAWLTIANRIGTAVSDVEADHIPAPNKQANEDALRPPWDKSNKFDAVTKFFQLVYDGLADMDSSIRPDKKSRWAGFDNVRFFNIWFNEEPWHHKDLCYKSWIEEDYSQFNIFLFLNNARLESRNISVESVDHLLKGVEGFDYSVNDKGRSLGATISNANLSVGMRQQVTITLRALIHATAAPLIKILHSEPDRT